MEGVSRLTLPVWATEVSGVAPGFGVTVFCGGTGGGTTEDWRKDQLIIFDDVGFGGRRFQAGPGMR